MQKNNKNPLISIIIATKNRQKYAESAVESILSIEDNRIEIVIQDNSDEKSLSDALEKYSHDNRLRYRYTPPPFSSIDNFNAGIELSTGEYICLIGDDDGINPEIIEATLWAKSNNIDVLVGNLSANYRWKNTGAPDTFFTKMTGDTLTISHYTSQVINPNIYDNLLRLASNGYTNYLDYNLPKLYHGIVRRKHMEHIKAVTGNFVNGLSPDIYASVALACFVKKTVIIDYPLTIPGVCGQSTSITEGQIKQHSKCLEDAPHFRDRGNYEWSKEVPRIYCVQTIWADSALAALRDMNNHKAIQQMDKYMLYALIISRNPTVRKDTLTHMHSAGNSTFFSYLLLLKSLTKGPFYKFLKQRVTNRIMILLGKKKHLILTDLHDIKAAMHALEIHLQDKGLRALVKLNESK